MGDNAAHQKSPHDVSDSSAPQYSPSVPTQSSTASQIAKIPKDSKDVSKTAGFATKSPKIVDLTEKTSPSECPAPKSKESSKSKVVELDAENSNISSSFSKINIDSAPSQSTLRSGSSGGGRVPDILTYSPGAGADIQEASNVPLMADEEVREVLKDQKVMETLMDPQVMNIIQLLRSDPEKAQRYVLGLMTIFLYGLKIFVFFIALNSSMTLPM